MSVAQSLKARDCWPRIPQVVPYLAFCLVLFTLAWCVVAAVALQAKITFSRSLDAKPRTPSRVEMQLLADLSTRQRFPTPNPRPNQDRLSARADPQVSAVTLAAQIDVLERRALSAGSAEATPKARRSSTKRKQDARVASWVKRSPRNIKQESTHDITLRNLIVADLRPPTKRL